MAVVIGTSGNDTISSRGSHDEPEDDLIQGLGGEDTIFGGYGADTYEGGAGNDHFTAERGDTHHERIDGRLVTVWADDEGADTFDGGDGIDTVTLILFSFEESLFGLRPYIVNLSSGTSNFGSRFIDIENITGSRANDTLIGSQADNTLRGWLGDDDLRGNAGNDALSGEAGTDTLDGGSGNDTLTGGAASDVLYGGGGDDRMSGSTLVGFYSGGTPENGYDPDTLFGGPGNDDLSSYSERDVLHGDGGDDTFTLAFFRPEVSGATVQVYGGAGFDEIDIFGANATVDWEQGVATVISSGVTHTFSFEGIERIEGIDAPEPGPDCLEVLGDDTRNTFEATAEAECFDGMAEDDTVDYSASGAAISIDMRSDSGLGGDADGDQYMSIEQFIGSDFDDILRGDSSRTLFDAGRGDDFLNGWGGTDILSGEGGADTIIGGGGRDRLFGGGGSDMLTGGAGKDILKGGTKTDTLSGGAADDTLFGGGGSDTIDGGGGADTIEAGPGRDRIISSSPDDTIAGGGGGDTVDFSEGARRLVMWGGEAGEWAGNGFWSTTAMTGVENVIGTTFDDIVRGTHGNDRLRGGEGGDALVGNQGRDVLDGGAGRDKLFLGFGVHERAAGGEGRDRFIVSAAEALDTLDIVPDTGRQRTVVIQDFGLAVNNGNSVGDTLDFRGFGAGLTADDIIDSVEPGNPVTEIVLPGVTVRLNGFESNRFLSRVTAENGVIVIDPTLTTDDFSFL